MAKTLQVRLENDIKEKADELFSSLGLDTTTAVRMFISAALRNGTISFLFAGQPRSVVDPMIMDNTESLRAALAEYETGANGFSLEEVDERMRAAIVKGKIRVG